MIWLINGGHRPLAFPRIAILRALLVRGVVAWSIMFAAGSLSPARAGDLPDFALSTINGQKFRFGAQADVRYYVVCFLGTECPLAQLYGPRLARLNSEFKQHGCHFVGVFSNRQDSVEEVQHYVKRNALELTAVMDTSQEAVRFFDAIRTPEVFVVDRDMNVCYQGRIDNQFQPGIARPAATEHDLKRALELLVAGKPVASSKSVAVGCLITRMPTSTPTGSVTFCRDIAPILNARCVECHRSGEIAPFALTDYDEIVGWGDMIVEVLEQGRMPPWHADPRYGSFANARQMPTEEKQKLRDWVSAGMPFGEKAELPESEWAEQPSSDKRAFDAEFAMAEKPFRIPAEGTIEYQYFVVDPKFTEPTWVKAADVIPGDRSVVHHVIVFIRPPDGSDVRGVSWLTAFVPGQRPMEFPDGYARLVPAGSKFAFQMHYTPNGRATEDLTKLRLRYVDQQAVTHEVFTLAAMDQELDIPPHADNHLVPLRLSHFPVDGTLLGVAPHMHLRGKSFRLTAQQPESSEILLDVPHYDFKWQHFYALTTPLPLDGVDHFDCVVGFDNSAKNPANPDPTQRVTWGDQTWEEMAIAFFEVAQPRSVENREKRKATGRRDKAADKNADATEARTKRIQTFVDDFFRRFDHNRDGRVAPSETPNGIRRFGFRAIDHNRDQFLDRSEVTQEADRRM